MWSEKYLVISESGIYSMKMETLVVVPQVGPATRHVAWWLLLEKQIIYQMNVSHAELFLFGFFFIIEMMMTSMMLPLWLALILMKKVPELWLPTLTWLEPRYSPVKMNPFLLLYLYINAYLKWVRNMSFPFDSVSFGVMRFWEHA